MTSCDHCHTPILFGGVRDGSRRFCGRKCLKRSRVSSAVRPAPNDSVGDGIGSAVIILAMIAYGAYAFWYAPSHRDDESQSGPAESGAITKQQSNLGVVLKTLRAYIPDVSPRVERLQAGNLDVYLTLREYQEVLFPDRQEFIRRIGKAWCLELDRTFLPALQLRDIKTGEVFGGYSCAFGKVSVNK